ncbi:DUF4402 domain-containing protein [Daejeonella oryzae]|uniref:DUF4402 domain-containing protein n=1 Tax=Daejeonella oryzae TaxID=1122943 RepID=UPI0006862142|nr:DUF4402 domain-containing protein [Daejeonella oryzae]
MILINHISFKSAVIFITVFLALASFRKDAMAQQKPPRPLSVVVNPLNGLNFGAFYQGISGGSVIVYANGSRSVSGDVILANLGYLFSPAIFEVQALPGTLIHILNGPDITLTGSNGGSMTMKIGEASTGSTFISTLNFPSSHQVRIGAILTVGNPVANPPGAYSGTFSVTFIQE